MEAASVPTLVPSPLQRKLQALDYPGLAGFSVTSIFPTSGRNILTIPPTTSIFPLFPSQFPHILSGMHQPSMNNQLQCVLQLCYLVVYLIYSVSSY
jgi:hypothetical protein